MASVARPWADRGRQTFAHPTAQAPAAQRAVWIVCLLTTLVAVILFRSTGTQVAVGPLGAAVALVVVLIGLHVIYTGCGRSPCSGRSPAAWQRLSGAVASPG